MRKDWLVFYKQRQGPGFTKLRRNLKGKTWTGVKEEDWLRWFYLLFARFVDR